MKTISATLLFVVLGVVSGVAQTRFDVTMTVDSVQRQFIVVRPSGAVPSGGYPVVMVFHGTSGDGERFYNISGWKEKGEAESFITVFPSSLRYCVIDSGKQSMTTKWNNGDLQRNACAGQNFKNDVHFVRVMLDSIFRTFPINHSRVYVTGFSNGSVFASKLAVEISDIIAATASVAGPLDALDSAAPLRKIPQWMMVGTMDQKFLEVLGIPEIPFNDSCMIYAGSIVQRTLGTFSLQDTFTKAQIGGTLSYRYTTPIPGTNATEYTFTLVRSMTHEYPNGSNFPLVAANLFWDFFNRFTLPSAVSTDARSGSETLTLFPNPASSHIVIPGEGEVKIVLRDMLGNTVLSRTAHRGTPILLPKLATGVYIAEVAADHSRSTVKLLLCGD